MNKKSDPKKTATGSARPKSTSKQRFPLGWDERRVRQVLDHYENQTEEERAAEIEAAYAAADHTLVSIPNELVPAVLKLIARHEQGA